MKPYITTLLLTGLAACCPDPHKPSEPVTQTVTYYYSIDETPEPKKLTRLKPGLHIHKPVKCPKDKPAYTPVGDGTCWNGTDVWDPNGVPHERPFTPTETWPEDCLKRPNCHVFYGDKETVGDDKIREHLEHAPHKELEKLWTTTCTVTDLNDCVRGETVHKDRR